MLYYDASTNAFSAAQIEPEAGSFRISDKTEIESLCVHSTQEAKKQASSVIGQKHFCKNMRKCTEHIHIFTSMGLIRSPKHARTSTNATYFFHSLPANAFYP